MADSIPSLRRKLDEALREIDQLRSRLDEKPATVERIVYVDREVEVASPPTETVVYVDRPVPGDTRVEYIYVDRDVPGPERVVEVEKVVHVPGPERVVEVEKVVTREVPVYYPQPVPEYVDNPELLRMIEELQGRLQAYRDARE